MTGLPINYLITVNFHGFKEIVDKLGGIWLDVDRRYYHVNNGTRRRGLLEHQHPARLPAAERRRRRSSSSATATPTTTTTGSPASRSSSRRSRSSSRSNFSPLDAARDRLGDHPQRRDRRRPERHDGARLRCSSRCTLPGGHFFQDQIAGRHRQRPDEHLAARTSQAVGLPVHPPRRRPSSRRPTPRRSGRS